MTIPTAHRLAAPLALTLALAACGQKPAPAGDTAAETPPAEATQPAAPAAAEPATVPGTDAIEAVDNGPLEPGAQTIGGVDTKAFAGTFATTGTRIAFNADGTYAMTVHAAGADADLESTGTWTTQAGGKRLLLDSDDKSEPDRRYDVLSRDEIRQTEGGRTLRREGAQ